MADREGFQPKYIFGRPNPNYTGPQPASESGSAHNGTASSAVSDLTGDNHSGAYDNDPDLTTYENDYFDHEDMIGDDPVAEENRSELLDRFMVEGEGEDIMLDKIFDGDVPDDFQDYAHEDGESYINTMIETPVIYENVFYDEENDELVVSDDNMEAAADSVKDKVIDGYNNWKYGSDKMNHPIRDVDELEDDITDRIDDSVADSFPDGEASLWIETHNVSTAINELVSESGIIDDASSTNDAYQKISQWASSEDRYEEIHDKVSEIGVDSSLDTVDQIDYAKTYDDHVGQFGNDSSGEIHPNMVIVDAAEEVSGGEVDDPHQYFKDNMSTCMDKAEEIYSNSDLYGHPESGSFSNYLDNAVNYGREVQTREAVSDAMRSLASNLNRARTNQ